MGPTANRDTRLSQTIRIDIPPDALAATRPEKPQPPQTDEGRDVGPAVSRDFMELFQSVYDAALITDGEGRILLSNGRAQEFLRYREAELKGLGIAAIISGADEHLPSTIRSNLRNSPYTLIHAYCIAQDRHMFPAEISVNQVTLFGRVCLCFFIRDITLRKRTEEMLATVHNAIQNAGDGIAITDRNAVLRYVNPAVLRLWGCAQGRTLVGESVRTLWCVPMSADPMLQTVTEGRTWSGEMTGRRCDAGEVSVQVLASPNRDPDGELQGFVFSFEDIRDRKRAEDAQRQAERHRVMLESIGAACHHLGQPATVLLASLSLMHREQDRHAEEFTHLLQASLDAAESLGETLHELNAISEYQTVAYLGEAEATTASKERILKI